MKTSKGGKIGWIEISKKKYGGVVYNDEARDFLAGDFNVDLVDCSSKVFKKNRPFKLLESFFYLLKLKGERDIWIRDFYSTITMPLDGTKGKNFVMIHHLDFSGFTLFARVVLNFLKELFFFRALKKADGIVTVSTYWQDYFIGRGYKNVFKIYNGFNLSEFHFTQEEVVEFKKKYNLLGKPIIYLGNCQKPKGVVEAEKALNGLNVHLVTSGVEKVKIAAKNLNLSYRDYLILLKSSAVVLTMSKFKEGWCRTAHEAMLCKTPVIGSGTGGMRELLAGGKQTICSDLERLKEEVKFLLDNPEKRKEMGESGYNFAKNFTQETFKKSWADLITKILN